MVFHFNEDIVRFREARAYEVEDGILRVLDGNKKEIGGISVRNLLFFELEPNTADVEAVSEVDFEVFTESIG